MGHLGISVLPLWATYLLLYRITSFPASTPNCSHSTRRQKMPRDPLGDQKNQCIPSHSWGGGAFIARLSPCSLAHADILLQSTPHSLLIDIGITNQEVNSWNCIPTIRSQMCPEASVAILRLTHMTSLAPASASPQKPSKPSCQKEKEPSLGD